MQAVVGAGGTLRQGLESLGLTGGGGQKSALAAAKLQEAKLSALLEEKSQAQVNSIVIQAYASKRFDPYVTIRCEISDSLG